MRTDPYLLYIHIDLRLCPKTRHLNYEGLLCVAHFGQRRHLLGSDKTPKPVLHDGSI